MVVRNRRKCSQNVSAQMPSIYFVDANQRMYTQVDGVTGDALDNKDNSGNDEWPMIRFCRKMGLIVTNTFGELIYDPLDLATFVPSQGFFKKRCDYILVSRHIMTEKKPTHMARNDPQCESARSSPTCWQVPL